jgi:hypothetical protein
VTLAPPHVRKGKYRREAVSVWATRVWEESPPAGEEPLEWLPLADQPVEDGKASRRVVGWYERRPIVEEFHKGRKTGAGIERPQLRDAESLRAGVALLGVVAVALVNLLVAARRYVPGLWVRGLTVREFTLALARLGGHLNRNSDGLPGWITPWRGWERLHATLDYEMARATCG